MKLSLKRKILAFVIIPMLIAIGLFSTFNVVSTVSSGEKRVKEYKENLLSERKESIKNYVEIALKSIEGLPTKEAALAAQKLRYANNGYFFIIDFNNITISHVDPKLIGTDQSDLKDPNGFYFVREIAKLCKEKGEGYISYMWKPPGSEQMRPKLSYAKTVNNTNWIISTGVYIDDIDALVVREHGKINKEITALIVRNIVIALFIVAGLSAIAIFFVNRSVNDPIKQIIENIKNSNNDLTKKINITTEDEIGELARWFNNYIDNLREIIGMVSGVADNIHTYSATISSTMEQQSGFATQLSSSVVEISTTMEEFSSTATQIAQHSSNVVVQADKTLVDTRHGAHEVENLTAKFNDISLDLRSNLGEIVELGRKSKEINKIMEIIGNIANQTKLIAFNAALEAASAGEAGKRFGVVAVEIRRLADSVVVSTGEIEAKITEILDSVNRLVMSSDKSALVIQEGQEYAGHTVSLLAAVVDGVEDTTDAAHQISLSIQQQQIASSQVVIALKDIEQGVRHSTDSIRKATGVTGELAELSDTLRSLIMTFKLENENPAPAPAKALHRKDS